jgi:hypothetical protein
VNPLAQFRISPERVQAIDDWNNFPVWAMLIAGGRWDGERIVYEVTRKFCREAGQIELVVK